MTITRTTFDTARARHHAALGTRLQDHIRRLTWSADELLAHQTAALRRLLAHAIHNSRFHRERLSHVDPDVFEVADLPSLPLMTKTDLMEHFDEVITDPAISRQRVEAHLASVGEVPEHLDGEYVVLTSGGSSGQRGVFVLDADAMLDMNSSALRSSVARLQASGGPAAGGLVVAMVGAPLAKHATRAGTELINGSLGRVVQAPVTWPISRIVETLQSASPQLLLGYPSVLRSLADEQRGGALNLRPSAILTTSEELTPDARVAISSAFEAPVINVFGSSEGLMGSSEPNGEPISFASDLALAEPVDEDGQAVGPGTPSKRVLVTNISNLTTPLIRYELSDCFVPLNAWAGEGPLRATVEGRSDEVFRYGELTVHPLVFRSVLTAQAISEYRVRQTLRGAEVEVVLSPDAGSASDAELSLLTSKLSAALTDAGVGSPEVTITCVHAIPRDESTGKVRRFVPWSA